MKHLLALALLVFAACSSSDGLITSAAIEGGPGQPISVSVGIDEGVSLAPPPMRGMDNTMPPPEQQLTLKVEVSNLSDGPLTVHRILASQPSGDSAFHISSTSRVFDLEIPEGKDHLFDLPVTGRAVRPTSSNESIELVVRVVVELSNGDSYYYSFAIPG